MKPKNCNTYIFLDSGDPEETKNTIAMLGFLDGQTTNPSLISKNPDVQKYIKAGKIFTKEDVLQEYHQIVSEISRLIPDGSVSVEVYADKDTKHEEMFSQSEQMYSWIPNAHIKFPTTKEGLAAAEMAVQKDIRVNMTLCFTSQQAAAVYVATQNAGISSLPPYKNVFISPFVGRLDDRGDNGMDLIKNIKTMYAQGDGHVSVLTASVRTIDHFLYALQLESDIITAPFSVLKAWKEMGCKIPDRSFVYDAKNLRPIAYAPINLEDDWHSFSINDPLVGAGVDKFAADWNKLIQQ